MRSEVSSLQHTCRAPHRKPDQTHLPVFNSRYFFCLSFTSKIQTNKCLACFTFLAATHHSPLPWRGKYCINPVVPDFSSGWACLCVQGTYAHYIWLESTVININPQRISFLNINIISERKLPEFRGRNTRAGTKQPGMTSHKMLLISGNKVLRECEAKEGMSPWAYLASSPFFRVIILQTILTEIGNEENTFCFKQPNFKSVGGVMFSQENSENIHCYRR